MALVFDELGFTGHLSTASGELRQTVQSTNHHAPPSMIVPRFPGEPLRLDCVIPLHPRGTGCSWPPEARVDASSGAGRFPLAVAWAGLPRGQKWSWRPEDHVLEVDCARAIAVAFSDVVRLHPSLHSDGVPTLVIPNSTRETEQQALLDEARQAGVTNGFLDPGSELAIRIKDTFRQTIQMHRSGGLTVLGGAVDLPRALQQMIDYVDRRGVGSILLGTADD